MAKSRVRLLALLALLLFISTRSYTQSKEIIRAGLIKAHLTISPSKMVFDARSYFYLHGNTEVFLSRRVSVAGEGYYYLGPHSPDRSNFDYNHTIFFGASWHLTSKNNDLYVGIQPGISMTRLSRDALSLSSTTAGINPVFSTVFGYNYFVNTIFHFFVQSRILAGEHNFDVHKNLTEFRLSAGLGFNLNARKE